MVLQLAEEGAIDLDAGIDSFMPELAGASRITPRQLLQHTSGLAEYINEPAVVNDANRPWTPAELIAVAEATGRVGQPGEAFHYSNTNFIILGEIIQQVTGHRWSDEVRTRIVEPLGLTHTREATDQRPVGYKVLDDGSFVDSTFSADPSIGGAAGALLGTSRDLVTFGRALRDGTLLSPESMAAMRTFVPGEDYSPYGIVHGSGLGLEQYATDGLTVNGHMGTGEAQSAFYGVDIERGSGTAWPRWPVRRTDRLPPLPVEAAVGVRTSGAGDTETGQQAPHPLLDLVADGADGLDVLAGGVRQLPVLVALAGNEGAGVTTTHGDDHVGGSDRLVGPPLGGLARDVDADLLHGEHG